MIGEWDFGLYHFYGTSREPRFLLGSDVAGRPVLAPRYDLIHQTGLDVQATLGSTLWKLEAIHRSGQGDSLVAASGGFEYTLFGLMGTMADLGLLGEYHFDSEGEGNTVRFEDDIFAGFRLALNDVQSSELLFGAIVDRESKARLFSSKQADESLTIGSSRYRLGSGAAYRLPIRNLPFATTTTCKSVSSSTSDGFSHHSTERPAHAGAAVRCSSAGNNRRRWSHSPLRQISSSRRGTNRNETRAES